MYCVGTDLHVTNHIMYVCGNVVISLIIEYKLVYLIKYLRKYAAVT